MGCAAAAAASLSLPKIIDTMKFDEEKMSMKNSEECGRTKRVQKIFIRLWIIITLLKLIDLYY